MILKKHIFLLLVLLISCNIKGQIVNWQDDQEYFDSILNVEVENVNAVYKPVLGFGTGVMNFYGEVHNNVRNTYFGQPAFKFNVATFLDKKHYFKTNFTLLMGSLSGDQRSTTDTALNLNFKSDIVAFGVNIHYDFKHFFRGSLVKPYVSIGIENVQFNSKGDLKGAGDVYYKYWSDGTIRNMPEEFKGMPGVNIIQRDYNYETDLRSQNLYGLGNYSQSTLAIPVDVGIDFQVSDRINLRIGNSWHYTFTDLIDNVSYKNTKILKGDKRNDMFTFSYFTLHFDLFSDDRMIRYRKAFEDVTDKVDQDLFSDEDNDQVWDMNDKCFGTPYGVPVDSVGCPTDLDKDGVFDYMDKEINSPKGAIVDENGVQINKDALAEKLNVDAIGRRDVETFILMHKAQSKGLRKSSIPLPQKFKSLDIDGDKTISFDELLKAIDNFFDFSSDLKTQDMYDLQDFFFEQ
jgi:hypothetical protein